MMNKHIRNIFLFFSIALITPSFSLPAAALNLSEAPSVIHYQSRLRGAEGIYYEGNADVKALIYDSSTLGVEGDLNDAHLIFAESHNGINVERGILRLGIGEGTGLGRFLGVPLPMEDLATTEELFLELYVNDEKITPRQQLAHVANAHLAEYSKRAGRLLQWPPPLTMQNLPDNISASSIIEDSLHSDRFPELLSTDLEGSVDKSTIPVGISLNNLAAGSLNTNVIPEFSASKVTSGTFDSGMMPTELLQREDIYMNIGTVSHGGIIDIPTEYTRDQDCAWMVSLNYFDGIPGEYDLCVPIIDPDCPLYETQYRRDIHQLTVNTHPQGSDVGVSCIADDYFSSHAYYWDCDPAPCQQRPYPHLECNVNYLLICKH